MVRRWTQPDAAAQGTGSMQRAAHFTSGCVAQPTYDTIGRTQVLDLLHPAALAALVLQIQALRDDSVEASCHAAEPLSRFSEAPGSGRERDGCVAVKAIPFGS